MEEVPPAPEGLPVKPELDSPPPSPGRHLSLLRSNLLRTVNYCLLFSLVGMSDASLGAALPGLACLARTSEQRIAYLFLFHELSVLMVTLLVGWLNRRNVFNVESRRGRLGVHLVLLLVATLMPCCFLLVPQCRSLTGLAFAFSAMGLLEGCLEFFCNAQMLRLYRSQAGPFLQAMFFCQSLGAFASPLIIGAFLANPAPHEWLNCTLPEAEVAAAAAPPAAREVAAASVYMVDDELESVLARVRYPFFVIAAIQAPIMASMCALTYKEAVKTGGQELQRLTDDDEDEEGKETGPTVISSSATCWILLFASLCAFALDGILGSYSSLIFAFSMRSVPTREERGRTAYLPATFWGFTLVGRLSGIFLSLKLSSTGILLIDMVGLITSAVMFLLGQDNIGLLFAATAATGFFVSHCMPALLALTEQFIRVTKDATICLVSSAAFGEALLPVVMAAAMHGLGTGAYPVGHFLFVIIACCLSCLYIGIGHKAAGGSGVSLSAERLFLGEAAATSKSEPKSSNYGSQLHALSGDAVAAGTG